MSVPPVVDDCMTRTTPLVQSAAVGATVSPRWKPSRKVLGRPRYSCPVSPKLPRHLLRQVEPVEPVELVELKEPAPAPALEILAATIKKFRIILDQRLDKEGVDVCPETMQLAPLLQQQYQEQSTRVDAPRTPVVSHGLNAASFPVYARRFTGTSVKDEVRRSVNPGRSVPRPQYDVNLISVLRYI